VLESPPDPKTPLDPVNRNHTKQKISSRLKSLPSRSPIREARHQHAATADMNSTSIALKSPVNRLQTQTRKSGIPAHSQPAISSARMSHPEVRSEPRQLLIRRVQAVVEMPVKEEDMEEDLLEPSELSTSVSASTSLSASASGLGSGSAGASSQRRKAKQLTKSHGRTIVHSDDGEESGMEDDVDEIEELDSDEGVSSANESSDEEDDELMMGAEVSRYTSLCYESHSNPSRKIARSSMAPSRLSLTLEVNLATTTSRQNQLGRSARSESL
jgi:hypothetical protein